MYSKTGFGLPVASLVHPPVGTIIDAGSFEMVEILAIGNLGTVYRAIDPRRPSRSYAVKCLATSRHHPSHLLKNHLSEINLHQLASAHPGVIALHRVVNEGNYTYVIMEYAPDDNLAIQIRGNRRYLGNNMLIKDIFLQLLDAIQYCHSLGIYHRDITPQNIVCFDSGLRIAITDFGLATTDQISDDIVHAELPYMGPECQSTEFAPTRTYSPMFNDVWSLGIILLNLVTARNPWKSASLNDPIFHSYLQNPTSFLPTTLPISSETNNILIRMLEADWRSRIHLRDVPYAIRQISNFYSDDAIIEGSIARCPWKPDPEIDGAILDSKIAHLRPELRPAVPKHSPLKSTVQKYYNSAAAALAQLSIRSSPSSVGTSTDYGSTYFSRQLASESSGSNSATQSFQSFRRRASNRRK